MKKRHSLSDPADSLIKYLSANVSTTNVPSTASIQVRDESILTDTKISPIPPPVVAYENLLDLQANIQRLEAEEQRQEEQEASPRVDEEAILIETIGQIGEDRRTFAQTKTVVIDRRNLFHRIDLNEFIGEMLQFSQRDFLRFERNRGHFQEDVQRTARLRHQIVVEFQRHI